MSRSVLGNRRPSDIAEKVLHLDGEPLSLFGRNYLRPIYDYGHRDIILKCGRQVEKSSTLRHVMLVRSIFKAHHRSLYVSPSQSQTSDYAKELEKLVAGSPYIEKNFTSNSLVNQTLERQFTNGSTIKLRSAYLTADRCRGISAKDLYIDEIQDFMMHNLPVIEECQSHYPSVSRRMYSGTPKSFNNPIEMVWQDSTRNEWMVQCKGCNKYNDLGVDNVGKEGLICSKCGKKIDSKDGFWVKHRPNALFQGYRISQLMVPFSDWDKTLEKLERYSTAKFHNEVLGLSYDSSDVPITEAEMIKASDPNFPMLESQIKKYQSFPMFMGIDWGTSEEQKSKTVVTVGFFKTPTQFQVVYVKKFGAKEKDPLYQLEEIVRMFGRFKCQLVCCDFGFGHVQNKILQNRLGYEKVAVICYSQNQKKSVVWNKTANMFVVSKPKLMSNVFSGVKLGSIKFFRWADMEKYEVKDDWLNISTEYDERSRSTRYIHGQGFPDDGFHSCLYSRFAGLIYYGRHTGE